jgi:hypothetical protein
MTVLATRTDAILDRYVMEKAGGACLMPLKEVTYEVEIISSLAVVTQKRKFRNETSFPMEAVMTFPVGFEAVVFDVCALVKGRRLKGVAKQKVQARKEYENALDDGMTTILHEELLQGLHMVSVGNIAPEEQVEVEIRSVVPLSMVAGVAHLRIPMTIGQIYGESPLFPSDDIVSTGSSLLARVSIHGANPIKLNGADYTSPTLVSTGGVIDIKISNLGIAPLQFNTTDGQWAVAHFSEQGEATRSLDVDLVLDSSGSMAERSNALGRSKWDYMMSGLRASMSNMFPEDKFHLWTFSNDCLKRGSGSGGINQMFLDNVPFDNGGTNLSLAIEKVSKSKHGANILLVTDGRSHKSLDIEAIRKSGARVSVVLIGSAAFESSVGQLALATGGQMFVVDASDDVAKVVSRALSSMRHVPSPLPILSSERSSFTRQISGLTVSVDYHDDKQACREAGEELRAFVTGLMAHLLPDTIASKLSEEAGIVNRHTSIVMVDVEGEQLEDFPVTAKVPLSNPIESLGMTGVSALMSQQNRQPGITMRNLLVGSNVSLACFSAHQGTQKVWGDGKSGGLSWQEELRRPVFDQTEFKIPNVNSYPYQKQTDLRGLMYSTKPKWEQVLVFLNTREKAVLDATDLTTFEAIASNQTVKRLAESYALDVIVLAIGLVASVHKHDRTAVRIAKKLLNGVEPLAVQRVLHELQIS